ncbi:MAG: hypothetical protein ABI429_10620 [Jatrophihabitantaceae bacterium]
MLTTRRIVIVGVLAAAVAVAVAVTLIVRTGSRATSGTRTHQATHRTGTPSPARTTAPGVPQPPVPGGWSAQTVGQARVAIPDGWRLLTTGAGGTTVAAWSPGPAAPGALPSRCAIQDRPQWLLSFLTPPNAQPSGHPIDWTHALQNALAAMQATTDQGPMHASVLNVHAVQVRGAVAAIAFTAEVTDSSATAAQRALDTADLLAAMPDGTEVHVFCSGPAGTLPADLADGVDSATLN